MASVEFNRHLAKCPQAAQAALNQAAPPLGGSGSANPPGDNGDGNWESAWIDLGGEG
jgi:hypothetical protein